MAPNPTASAGRREPGGAAAQRERTKQERNRKSRQQGPNRVQVLADQVSGFADLK